MSSMQAKYDGSYTAHAGTSMAKAIAASQKKKKKKKQLVKLVGLKLA